MGIIRKENAGAISSFSFGVESTGPVEASEWSLTDSGSEILPLPGSVPDSVDVHETSANGAVPVEGEMPTEIEPPEPIVQPVFEVPEEILTGFYENVIQVGLEDGKNQVFAELQVLQERYASALDELAAVGRELAAQNQIQVMTLSCMIAERLLRDEIKVRPERLLELVRESLNKATGTDRVSVKCSPGDHEYLVQRRASLEDGLGGSVTVRVELDETLEYGDFQIESDNGIIDGRVGTRVADVQKSMMEPGSNV